MRKLSLPLLVLLLSAIFVAPGFGQGVTAGVKAGVDFADLGGDFDDLIAPASTDLKTGFSFGGYLGADVHRLFRLQADLQFVQKGAKAEEGGAEAKFKLDYLEVLVPLTLLIPIEGGTVQPRLYAGPSLAFELDCKAELSQGGATLEFDCDDEEFLDAPTKSVDYGIFFGGGIDLEAGPGVFTIDLLYNLGLGNIADEVPEEVDLSVKNRNIQVLAGYGFKIGG